MSPKFEVGAVVRLKSGGPKMTISDYIDTRVRCLWFSDTRRVEDGCFYLEMLELVKESNDE